MNGLRNHTINKQSKVSASTRQMVEWIEKLVGGGPVTVTETEKDSNEH